MSNIENIKEEMLGANFDYDGSALICSEDEESQILQAAAELGFRVEKSTKNLWWIFKKKPKD